MIDYYLAAVLHGRSAELASKESIDASLREFQSGGSKYDKWMQGDPELNEERLSLYKRKYPGTYEVE
jgi:hypothetical protein